jgi:(p)ppGpp synthase/HD superfamily hydrolase
MDDQEPNIVKRAEAWVQMSHAGRTYGNGPYTDHLQMVVGILTQHGFGTPKFLAAGWLHDDLEDTATTLEQLQKEFGNDVAEIVFAVTDEPGKNRRERHAKTFPKIQAVPGAVIIKLADRIANVESSWRTRDAKLFMYRNEYGEFREALRREAASRTVLAMWERLDKLLGWTEWDTARWNRQRTQPR